MICDLDGIEDWDLIKGAIEQVALFITVVEGEVSPACPVFLFKSRVHFVQLRSHLADLQLVKSHFGTIVVVVAVVVMRSGRSLAARARSEGKTVVGGFSLRCPTPVLKRNRVKKRENVG